MANEVEIYLPISVYAAYRLLNTEAHETQDFSAWMDFLHQHEVIVRWDCVDRHGAALNPAKREDWDKLSVSAVSRLALAVNNHIRGADEAAKN